MTTTGARPERWHHAPIVPRALFLRRLGKNGLVGIGLIAVSLLIGTIGYHLSAGLDWVDSILNASMILTGMGQVDPLHTTGAKLFASGYAIFSGVAFLSIIGIVIAPVVHRFLHRFHLDIHEAVEGANVTERSARGGKA